LIQELEGMTTKTETMTMPARDGGTSPDIRPFQVNFPEADLVELRRRIKATRWPETGDRRR
jgi:hypothetical protein